MDTEEKHTEIIERLGHVRQRIDDAARTAGRKDEVKLIAVTKYVEVERILPAVKAGVTEVGENRAQELTDKLDFFNSCSLKKHFIGTLQTNKVKYLVGNVDLIQSVDREAVLVEINRLAMKKQMIQPILIEVNIGGEAQKSGVAIGEIKNLLSIASDMPGIFVKGLMCIPPAVAEAEARPYFIQMRELFEKMKNYESANIHMQELSMGMSGDYYSAVLEGATYVRVGSAIFGQRNYNKK